MSDLLPCPFCGGKPYTRTRQDEDLSTHNIVDWHFVGCMNCDISFGIPDGYDCGTASEQWNTRAELPPDEWQDKDDDLTEAIKSDFRSDGFYARYHRAMDLVGNRRSKGALVYLVTYLLRNERIPAPPTEGEGR